MVVLMSVAAWSSHHNTLCNTLRHSATHWNTSQHAATYCNTLQIHMTIESLWRV